MRKSDWVNENSDISIPIPILIFHKIEPETKV